MKKILTLALLLTLCTATSFAQKSKEKLQTTVFKTDIVCQNCEKKIMNNVPTLGKGVRDVKVDLNTKEVTVTYDATKTSDETLVKNFAKIKVQAEPKPKTNTCTKSEGEKACCKEKAGSTCCKEKAGSNCCKESKGTR